MTDEQYMSEPDFEVSQASRGVICSVAELRQLSRRHPELVRHDLADLGLALCILARIVLEAGRAS